MNEERGVIAWMVKNRVTPNILMFVLIFGGLIFSFKIKQEVFPAFDLDRVSIIVPYPGASPEEVEQGIVLAIEESIQGVEGIKEIRGTCNEGVGRVDAELEEDADQQLVLQNIKQEVDRVRTLPDDAEDPVVTLATRRRQVVTVQLYGDVSEWVLRDCVEQTREALLLDPGISQIDLVGVRDYEVIVEVSQANLRRYGLTLRQIGWAINDAVVEIPGGKVETDGGEIMVRVRQRSDWADEFAQLPIITDQSGSVVRLGQIASVTDSFEDSKEKAFYNGKPAVGLNIMRIGEETPITVSQAARDAMLKIEEALPAGVDWVISSDRSSYFEQRMDLLFRNAFIGLILVLGVLGIFLEFKLAFWVTMGIPISFLGAFLFLPFLGVSINIISMFAFIISLGIVVDDAIVAGENIYEYRQRGMNFVEAAIKGARDVLMPITFAIITNCIAFLPLAMVPGISGKIWGVIPFVVITVFAISWIESLLILPCHLAHSNPDEGTVLTRTIHRWQQKVSDAVRHFIYHVYQPVLEVLLRWRYVTLAVALVVLYSVFLYVKMGHIGMIYMPRTESDRSVVTMTMPLGSPMSLMEQVRKRVEAASEKIASENGGDALSRGYFTSINNNKIEVSTYLTDPAVRPMSTGEFTRLWRKEAGTIPGIQSSRFESDRGGPGSGAAISISLAHSNIQMLEQAAAQLERALEEFSQVAEADSGYIPGKHQFDIQLTDMGRTLGFNGRELAIQVRDAFQGSEALRQQRGRNEVTIRLRRPESERASAVDINSLLVRAPNGTEVPLREVAIIERGRAYTSINRLDGRRTLTVTADVDHIGTTSMILAQLEKDVLPQLQANYLGLSVDYGGRQAARRDSMNALFTGLLVALGCIYILLAIPFRSYIQPLIVMFAIPFGVVGAVLGHVLMGYNISVISMMGVVALSGVVVNDSLVLINYINVLRRDGLSLFAAVASAGARRFRPIILTTLTTFGGLAPMIFETSRSARFLIPMALSVGFGILFATVITLILVPSFYLIIEDVKDRLRPFYYWLFPASRD